MSDIKDFKIKDGVLTKYIGSDAEVVIPDGVTSIRGTAFFNCSSLMSITIPDGITSIGKNAFSFCRSLTSVIIPDSVTSIGDGAFNFCSSLESITIPASVVGIGNGTFHNCSSLTSVTIPDGIRSIGEFAFSFCRSLTSITIPDSLVSIGNKAFMGCSSLQSITIPNSVTSIGFYAFEGCSSLKSVIIPDSVKSIGNNAFGFHTLSGHKKLTDIYFKNRKISDAYNVGNGNFDKKSLLQGYLENEAYLVESKEVNDSYVEYVRGQRKRLYKFAAEYKNLLRFMIDNEIIPVEDCDAVLDVVKNNAELTAMLLDYKNANFTFDDEIKAMNKLLNKTHNPLSVSEMKKIWSFKKLDDGTLMITNYKGSDLDVVIPETIGKSKVAVIGSSAFNPFGNRVNNQDVRLNIKSIVIPDSVTIIGYYAFGNCSSLQSITIPDSVTSIANFAFYGCSSLTIHAKTGSYAEQFAKRNQIPFEAE